MSIFACLRFQKLTLAMFYLATLLCLWAPKAQAAELVIFESEACEWCEIWNEEIGVFYSKTSEAKVVPLRRVDIDDDRPDDLKHLTGLVYTPTFIIMQEGKEVGRIIGYPGENFFWQLLNEILENKGLIAANGS